MKIEDLRLNQRVYAKAEGVRLGWGSIRSIHKQPPAVRIELDDHVMAIVKPEELFEESPTILKQQQREKEKAQRETEERLLELRCIGASTTCRSAKDAATMLGISYQKYTAIMRKQK